MLVRLDSLGDSHPQTLLVNPAEHLRSHFLRNRSSACQDSPALASELCSDFFLKQETPSPTMSPLASPPSSPPHYQRVPLSHGYSQLRSSTEQMQPGKGPSAGAGCPRQGLRDPCTPPIRSTAASCRVSGPNYRWLWEHSSI